MISIKTGVKINGLRPEILLGIRICEDIFKVYGIELVITEVTGGKHSPNSLHYKGLAVDIRSHDIETAADKYKILHDCVHALGDNFDMILESIGEVGEHYHLEAQF